MIKLEATGRELFEGNVAEGMTIWWEKGSRVILYQTWEHRAAGRVYHEVQHTYTSSDLLTYFNEQGWADEYKVADVVEIS
jgi:hypothetical protein